MAGDWIKMRTDLRDDPAIIAIANKTRLDIHGVVGRLHRFWSWADCHSQDGEFPGMDPTYIDKITSKSGFAQAMLDVNWLELSPSGFRVPRFGRHNGASAKKRVSNAASQKLSRKRHRDVIGSDDETVTREEKRREEEIREEKKEPKPRQPPPPAIGEIVLPDSINTPEVRTSLEAFIDQRKRNRKPPTAHAVDLLLRKLAVFKPHEAVKLLDDATIGGWQSPVFEKRQPSNGLYHQPPQQIPTNVGPTRAW